MADNIKTTINKNDRRLPWNERLSYGASDFACSFTFSLIGTYLMYFYTDVFGITAAAVGTLMLVARVIDALDGPFWGIMIDHTHTKWGRSRPYLLWFNAPFTIFTILCFTTPDLPMTWKIVWAYVTYIGIDVLYSAVNIPLTSILPSMTTNSNERVLLSTIRSLFSNFGGTLISVIALPLVTLFGGPNNPRQGFFWVAVMAASVFFVIYLVVFFNLREHVQTRQSKKALPIKTSLKALKNNWPWVIVVGLNFIYWLGMQTKGQVTLYFFKYNLDRPGLASLALFFNAVGLISVFLTPKVVTEFGKKKTILFGLGLSIAGQLILGVGAQFLNITTVIIGTIVGNFGNGFVGALIAVLLADSVDYGEWKNGVRAEGIVTSASSFTAKFGMGIGGAITGLFLSLGHYMPNKTQTPAALFSIEANYVWVPLVALVISFILILFYRLTPEKETEMTRYINAKHAREDLEDSI
ncbi:MFS transporter [Leuconostoc carnosum]|uniref:MFS transporter n=2 Tax=Leuconostoc carnosum TaxID=1252 RepID=A0AAE6IKA4_LEUCA|nr:glycoside-pentoside-hexuronide (GPH):cation symporter [Leuconostoc carnosum]AFT80971.1 putative xylose-proton symporter [Leuconostoc carnosum JB16]KAA8332337.1 MFS transporter [Leuconostoc carnosum]QEA33464.1 MFS transporter [Leuconostoc carnosum]